MDNEKNKLEIIPFNEFWINCHFAMLYSTLLSMTKCDRDLVYNNNYRYDEYEDKTDHGYLYKGIFVNTLMEEISNLLFINTKEYFWYDNPNLIEDIKTRIDNHQIVKLAVDMYYWIDDSYLYHKVHTAHNAIIIGYDDETRTMIALDGGNDGYTEHSVSYDHITEAAKYAKECPTLVSDIGKNLDDLKITYEGIMDNAKTICKSIDEMIPKLENIWKFDNADDHDLKFVGSMLCINFVGIKYRCKTNILLLKSKFGKSAEKYMDMFDELYEAYDKQKNLILKSTERGTPMSSFEKTRGVIRELLYTEKKVWLAIMQDQNLALDYKNSIEKNIWQEE